MPSSSNKLLASLSTNDFDLLGPHLESMTLGLRKNLERPNRRIDAVYFPEGGFASVVAVQSNGKETRSETLVWVALRNSVAGMHLPIPGD
jgi:hypothetical protein